ncbi:MAG: Crp/Fnr family transcriptional regulator [Bacteroidales bacterium]|nr:Crp/Fnr family transcriptional regulator [Bacteroidales bacterium]MCF8458475.1 Crp/Fnr family transcriptional regulator [Bacteroidales bacterium]
MKNIPSTPKCQECITSNNAIFAHLTKDEIARLELEKSCNHHKRGTLLYQEGNRINGFYCINKGIVKLYKTGIEGKEQIIKFAKKGDVIGYRSILSNEMACTTAKIIEDSTLCYIPGEFLITLVKTNTNFAMELMQLACKELKEANNFITDIAQKSVRERLAEILVYLKEDFDLDNDGVLQISLTREELANMVGTATESVIRLLSEFKGDKLIELTGRKIKIINLPGLMKVGNVYN